MLSKNCAFFYGGVIKRSDHGRLGGGGQDGPKMNHTIVNHRFYKHLDEHSNDPVYIHIWIYEYLYMNIYIDTHVDIYMKIYMNNQRRICTNIY